MFKRLFDIAGALLLLVPAAPVIALIALAIKLDDPGPVFFRQTRVGKGGRPFLMLKFRKMPVVMRAQGPMLTRRFDPRLTRVGRWLERTKLDELPQLFNVLRGDMSLIGPRPEVERFVNMADPRWQRVLQVPPGIFGLTQMRYRNESELYPTQCDDIEAWYRHEILPAKLESDMDYVSRAGLVADLRLLFGCVLVSVFGAVTGKGLRRHLTPLGMLLSDLVVAGASFAVACLFRLEEGLTTEAGLAGGVIAVVMLRGAVFLAAGTYRRRPSTLTYADLIRIAQTVLFGSVLLLLAHPLVRSLTGFSIPRTVILMDALMLTMLMMGKAHVIQQLLQVRSRSVRRMRLPVSMGLVSTFAFASVALLWLFAGARFSVPMITLLGATAVTRGYLYLRHGVSRTSPGWSFLVYDVPGMLRAAAIGSLLLAAVDNLNSTGLLTPGVLLLELGTTMLLTVAANRLAQRLGSDVRRGADAAEGRALMVGIGADTEHWLTWIDHLPPDQRPLLAGLVCATHTPQSQTINHVPVVGRVADLGGLLDSRPIRLVLVNRTELSAGQFDDVETVCRERGVPLRELPRADELFATASGDSLPALSVLPPAPQVNAVHDADQPLIESSSGSDANIPADASGSGSGVVAMSATDSERFSAS
ncbi:MAG: sugar transferase [Planctomycetota bacterium]